MENLENEINGLTPKHAEIIKKIGDCEKQINNLKEESKRIQNLNGLIAKYQGAYNSNATKAEKQTLENRIDAIREDIKNLKTDTEIQNEIQENIELIHKLNDDFQKITLEKPQIDFYPIIKFSNGTRELRKDANGSWWFYNGAETAESNVRVLTKDGIPSDLMIFSNIRGTPIKIHQKVNILNKEELEDEKVTPRIPYTLNLGTYWQCKNPIHNNIPKFNISSNNSTCPICNNPRPNSTNEENLAEKKKKETPSKAVFGKFKIHQI